MVVEALKLRQQQLAHLKGGVESNRATCSWHEGYRLFPCYIRRCGCRLCSQRIVVQPFRISVALETEVMHICRKEAWNRSFGCPGVAVVLPCRSMTMLKAQKAVSPAAAECIAGSSLLAVCSSGSVEESIGGSGRIGPRAVGIGSIPSIARTVPTLIARAFTSVENEESYSRSRLRFSIRM